MSDPIRVMRVIARLNMGGPALHVSYLTRDLDRRGYETTLVAGSLSRGEGSMAFVAEKARVPVVSVEPLARELSPLNDAVAVRRLVELLRQRRPHILHTHTAKAGAVGRLAAIAARDARPPVVVHTYHGHVLRGYFDPVRTELYRQIEKRLAAHTDRLVAVSTEVRDDLVELGVASAERFDVVRLGIELDERLATGGSIDYRRILGIPERAFVVGWIGRMTAIKRIEDVVSAFAEVLRRGVEARLVLVGDGPTRADAERLAHALGIMRSCLFLGYQRDVAPFYRVFDALFLPSGNEGTPVVAIESLAAGRPVVATRVGGVPDVVEDGVAGRLVPVGDVAAAAAALVEVARDDELRRRVERDRDAIHRKYAVERLVDDVDRLYRRLLADKGVVVSGR